MKVEFYLFYQNSSYTVGTYHRSHCNHLQYTEITFFFEKKTYTFHFRLNKTRYDKKKEQKKILFFLIYIITQKKLHS